MALIIISDTGSNTVEPTGKGLSLTQGWQGTPHLQKSVLGQFTANIILAHHSAEVESNAAKIAFIDLFKGLLISSLGLRKKNVFRVCTLFGRKGRVFCWLKHR